MKRSQVINHWEVLKAFRDGKKVQFMHKGADRSEATWLTIEDEINLTEGLVYRVLDPVLYNEVRKGHVYELDGDKLIIVQDKLRGDIRYIFEKDLRTGELRTYPKGRIILAGKNQTLLETTEKMNRPDGVYCIFENALHKVLHSSEKEVAMVRLVKDEFRIVPSDDFKHKAEKVFT